MNDNREKFIELANAAAEMKLKQFQLLKDFTLMHCELLDEDGYPTHWALELIAGWNWQDPVGFMEFVKSLWWYPDWGWDESEIDDPYREKKKVRQYDISTGGWSGNESLIRAMEKTDMLWYMIWVQSRRGGHYIFQINKEDENEN